MSKSMPVYNISSISNCCFCYFFSLNRFEVRSMVPKAKCDSLKVLYYYFFVIYLMSGCCCCGEIIFQDVDFVHYQQLFTVGANNSVTGWKLIYTVGKSSACAMIEILECVDSRRKGSSSQVRALDATRRSAVCVRWLHRFHKGFTWVSIVLCQCSVYGGFAGGSVENLRWCLPAARWLLLFVELIVSVDIFSFLCIMVKVQ